MNEHAHTHKRPFGKEEQSAFEKAGEWLDAFLTANTLTLTTFLLIGGLSSRNIIAILLSTLSYTSYITGVKLKHKHPNTSSLILAILHIIWLAIAINLVYTLIL